MARIRKRTSRETEAESRDILDRSHSLNFDSELDAGVDVSGDAAEFEDFGDTGGVGFAEAWDGEQPNSAESIAAIEQFGSDPELRANRDLDRTSRRGVVALVLIALVAGAGFWAFDQGYFEQSDQPANDDEAPVFELASPDSVRQYESGPSSAVLAMSISSSRYFLTTENGEPEPVDAAADELPSSITAGPVIWAGRLHVAVLGDGIGAHLDEQCVVASLVDAELLPIDVAGTGSCSALLAETIGDRLACVGDDLVMLEVWTDDPRTIGTPPPTDAVRVRIEQSTSLGVTLSVRGQLDVPPASALDPVPALAVTVAGEPGDTISLSDSGGGPNGTCELVDRAGVQVRLLPS